MHERELKVLPGFGATLAHATGTAIDALPGLPVDRRATVHADQALTLHGPIPASGRAVTTGRVVEVADLGRTALVRTRTETRVDGQLLLTARFGIAVRGAGGFGGARPRAESPFPSGPADARLDLHVSARQAVIYRLLGDRNPLHVDPEHAEAVGFGRPILHGLSTFGAAVRVLVDGKLQGDPHAVRSVGARFVSPVWPGDDLVVATWGDGDDVAFSVSAPARDTIVLEHGILRTT